MDIILNFDGWKLEQINSYVCSILGRKVMSPEEREAYYQEEERKYKERQKRLKEIYETRNSFEHPVYKKSCPICKTVFYTYNIRKIYDDYDKCSRYQHRTNAKLRRKWNRITKCDECGKSFTPERAGAKYCCAACKQRAYRARKNSNGQNDHMKQA